MCFCVRIGLLVVMWLMSGSDSCISVVCGSVNWCGVLLMLSSWMLCDVLVVSLIMFLCVSVCRCFLVVFGELKFSLVVILVWVGGNLECLIV